MAHAGERQAAALGSDPLQLAAQGTLILLLAAGFAALATTGRLPPAIIAAAISAFAARAFLWSRGVTPRIPARWQWAVVVLYVPVYILDAFLPAARSAPDLLGATLHFAVFAGLLKLFSFDSSRDQVLLGLLAFLELLTAGVLSEQLSFFAALLVFLGVIIAACVVHEVARSHRRAGPRALAAPARLSASLLRVSLGLSAAVLVLGALIFFLLPRTAPAAWQPRASNDALTGFSDEVALGAVADLQQNDTVVMHVHIVGTRPALPPSQLQGILWRGRGLTYFDGRRWSSFSQPTFTESCPGQWPRSTPYPQIYPPQLVQYQVTLEPLNTEVLFFPARMLETATPFFRLGWDSQTDTLVGLGGDFNGISYSGISDIAQPPASALRELPPILPRRAAVNYLQLPEALDPRIRSLAHAIVAATPNNNYDRMQALTNYLRSNYSYSLQDLPQGPDPLAAFLFQQKAGTCEYFASALAVLARSLGIPTRIVNGFTAGTYNPITGNYIVRGRNAHSWVEAWFPMAGNGFGFRTGIWVHFDATPAADTAADPGWGNAEFLRDAAASLWEEWIVKFDAQRQTALAHAAQTGIEAALQSQVHLASTLWQRVRLSLPAASSRRRAALLLAGLVLLLLVATGLLLLGWRRFTRRNPPPARAVRHARAQYRRFQACLRRAGCTLSPAQTAPELLAEFRRRQPPATALASASAFVAAYERLLFGAGDTDPAALTVPLSQLRSALR